MHALRFILYENQDLKSKQVNRDYVILTINGGSCPIIDEFPYIKIHTWLRDLIE